MEQDVLNAIVQLQDRMDTFRSEVAEQFAAQRNEMLTNFDAVYHRFAGLAQEQVMLKGGLRRVEDRLANVENGHAEVRHDIREIRHDIAELRHDVTELRHDVTELRKERT